MEKSDKKQYIEKTIKVDVECYAMLKQFQHILNKENNYTTNISLKVIVRKLITDKLIKITE